MWGDIVDRRGRGDCGESGVGDGFGGDGCDSGGYGGGDSDGVVMVLMVIVP